MPYALIFMAETNIRFFAQTTIPTDQFMTTLAIRSVPTLFPFLHASPLTSQLTFAPPSCIEPSLPRARSRHSSQRNHRPADRHDRGEDGLWTRRGLLCIFLFTLGLWFGDLISFSLHPETRDRRPRGLLVYQFSKNKISNHFFQTLKYT